METNLPHGFNWADGVDGRPGTPTPAGAITVTSAADDGVSIPIEEATESPEIERAEQATCVHRYSMSWDEALNQIQFYGRGTIVVDDFDNVFKVLSAKIQRIGQGSRATMTITSESLSFDSPPDQFQIVPVELGVFIIKYPRYYYAFLGESGDDELLNQSVIRALQNYFENVTAAYRDWLTYQLYYSISTNSGGHAVNGALTGGVAVPDPAYTPTGQTTSVSPIPGTDLAKAAAIEIIQKYWRNEETPYVVGYQITWSAYYFRPQYLNPGGYVEDPITKSTPQLPDYFWSPDFPPSSATIFDQLSTFNPQCYSSTGESGGPVVLSWLRKADQIEEQRTWFKVDRTWIGSPVGFWDPELYNAGERPSVVGDYDTTAAPKSPPKPAGIK